MKRQHKKHEKTGAITQMIIKTALNTVAAVGGTELIRLVGRFVTAIKQKKGEKN